MAQPAGLAPQTTAPFTNLLLATFTNGVAGSAVTNFSAAINWGDNSITTGAITTNAAGFKQVFERPCLHEFRGLSGLCHHPEPASVVTSVVSNTLTVRPSLTLIRTGNSNVLDWPAWAFCVSIADQHQSGGPQLAGRDQYFDADRFPECRVQSRAGNKCLFPPEEIGGEAIAAEK